MKTKSLLTAIVVVVLFSSVGYAQRVEAFMVDGCPVINCKAMPTSTYTTTPKGNTEEVLKTKEANEKVYKRFAVFNTDGGKAYWKGAFTICSGISGGEWRLPTQRELQLMWVLKSELERLGPLFATTGVYWSATEYDKLYTSWSVDFSNGRTISSGRTDSYLIVRCVKELPMP